MTPPVYRARALIINVPRGFSMDLVVNHTSDEVGQLITALPCSFAYLQES